MVVHQPFTDRDSPRHVLVVCPQAVAPAWARVVAAASRGDLVPWSHQLEIAEWVRQRMASLIASDMGTGKTFTALLSLGLDRPGVECLTLHEGASTKRAETLKKAVQTAGGRTLVVVVNYDAVFRGALAKTIEETRWAGIVLDESHRIKAAMGKASRWLHRLAQKQPGAKRICMTGTPMPHSPLDLFGQCRFLDTSLFGPSLVAMRRRYAECDIRFPSKVKRWLNQDELTAKLDSISWRVTADEVLDLPDAVHDTIQVPLSPATLRFYRQLESEMVAELDAGTVTASNALTKLLRMQQATSGYARTDEHGTVLIDGMPAKRAALEDRLDDLPATEPVVVFCRFRSDLNDVQAAAKTLGREYAEVSGERKDLERWQAGDATIIGVQIQSGGVGIDLSRAAYAVYYSLGFSLGDYEQSLARLRRPGQTRCVRYYHLVAPGTVDEQVYAALRERRSVVEAVLRGLSPRRESVA